MDFDVRLRKVLPETGVRVGGSDGFEQFTFVSMPAVSTLNVPFKNGFEGNCSRAQDQQEKKGDERKSYLKCGSCPALLNEGRIGQTVQDGSVHISCCSDEDIQIRDIGSGCKSNGLGTGYIPCYKI